MSQPVPPDRIRATDAERRAVQDLLQRAQGEGILDLSEYDERLQALWAGKTRGDLQRLTADLPELPARLLADPRTGRRRGGSSPTPAAARRCGC
jgi:hypothetical protein